MKKRRWKKIIWIVVILLIVKVFGLQSYFVSDQDNAKKIRKGDWICINKLAYGPRIPITPLTLPFFDQHIPFTEVNAYSDIIKLPYFRLPGFSKIRYQDFIVFNNPKKTDIPDDKKDKELGRIIGLPGDTLAILSGNLYRNNSYVNDLPALFEYRIITDGSEISDDLIREYALIDVKRIAEIGIFDLFMQAEDSARLIKEQNITNIRRKYVGTKAGIDIYPYSPYYPWNKENYGPFVVPAKGSTIKLNYRTIDLYMKIIEVYENNSLDEKFAEYFINGEKTKTYTFKNDYYFVLDDNRHFSKDSRHWGFLPESHIIGKAGRIVFSAKNRKFLASTK